MNKYTLVKNGELYEVYENGIKVKNAIFEGIEDFKNELELSGLSGQVIIDNTRRANYEGY